MKNASNTSPRLKEPWCEACCSLQWIEVTKGSMWQPSIFSGRFCFYTLWDTLSEKHLCLCISAEEWAPEGVGNLQQWLCIHSSCRWGICLYTLQARLPPLLRHIPIRSLLWPGSIFSWCSAVISPLDLLVTPFPQAFKREGLRAKHCAHHRGAVVIIAVRDEISIPFAFSLVYVICISKGVRSLCIVQGKSTFGQKTVWSEGFSFVQRDSTSHMRTLSAKKIFKKQVNYTYDFLKNHPELLFFWEREILFFFFYCSFYLLFGK